MVTVSQDVTTATSVIPAAENLINDVKTIKSSWKTSEFYFTILVSLGSIAASVANILPAKYAGLATAFSVGCYSISRGFAKS